MVSGCFMLKFDVRVNISKASKMRLVTSNVSPQIAEGQEQGPMASCLSLSLLVPAHVHLSTWLNALCVVR